MMRSFNAVVFCFCLFFLIACGKNRDSGVVVTKIIIPSDTLKNHQSFSLEIRTNQRDIDAVDYYLDQQFIGSSTVAPDFKYVYQPAGIMPGGHVVRLIAYANGKKAVQIEQAIYSIVQRGDVFYDGILFFITADGMNGLVAAKNDLSYTGAQTFNWADLPVFVDATDDDGSVNTQKMYSVTTHIHNAAYHFSSAPWYVPSLTEMELLSRNTELVGGFPAQSMGAKYWTSTELDATRAKAYDVPVQTVLSCSKKDSFFRIRAIRRL